MQRRTFNSIGPRPPVTALKSDIVRERMSKVGYLDPSVIIKTDETVSVSVDKNIYTISANLQMKFYKTIVGEDNTISLPTESFGIQEVLVNMEVSNDSPAFGELDDYTATSYSIDIGTNLYNGKLVYVKYLTTAS